MINLLSTPLIEQLKYFCREVILVEKVQLSKLTYSIKLKLYNLYQIILNPYK